MRTIVTSIGFVAVTGYVIALSLVALFQRSLIYHPEYSRKNANFHLPPPLRKISLMTEDGLALDALYAPPEKKDGPVILFFHGNAGSAIDFAYKMTPFMRAGYGALILEYRGYGSNPGTPSERGLLLDALSAVRFAQREAPSSRLIYYGESLGTGVAVQMALAVRPSALVLESGFSSLVDVAKKLYWYMPVSWMLKDRFDSKTAIKKLDVPVIIGHGIRDPLIPASQSQVMFEASPAALKELRLYPDGEHCCLENFGFIGDVLSFLSRGDPGKGKKG